MFSDWNFDFDLESEDFACCADILVLCPHQVISLASERTQAPGMEFLIFYQSINQYFLKMQPPRMYVTLS